MSAFELYLRLGWKHILDYQGYDHMLYIATLVCVYNFKEWKNVLVLVTAFTIGHSLTLFLSAAKIVQFNPFWIEFLISSTIVGTIAFNLLNLKQIRSPSNVKIRYISALLFGFIHGMGFSSYLVSLLGKSESLVWPLLSFNLGLELGQLVFVFVLLCLQQILVPKLINRRMWVLLISIISALFILPIWYEKGTSLFNYLF